MNISKRVVISFFFIISLILLDDSKAQAPGDRGLGGGGGRQEALGGEVVNTGPGEVTVNLKDGKKITIYSNHNLKVSREVSKSLEDIRTGSNILVIGRSEGNRVKAILIRLLDAENLNMPAGGREVTAGKVTSTSPLKIDSEGSEKDIDTSDVKKIFQETVLSLNDINKGDQVILIGPPDKIFKIIITSGGAQGGAPSQKRGSGLPMPDIPKVSLFNKEMMLSAENSPFGFKDPNMLRFDLLSWYADYGNMLNDLGAHWMEPAASFGFNWAQVKRKDQDGSYSGENWERYDRLVKNAQAYNIHISAIINAREPEAEERRRPPSLPRDLKGYHDFVRELVERYDGDGKDDMPGLLYPIKYWKIEDEAMAKIYFNGTGADYAKLVNTAYDAIKLADKDSNVILSMIRGYDGYTEVDPKAFMEDFFKEFSHLSKTKKWDLMDQHWMILNKKVAPEKQYLEIKKYIDDVSSACLRYGYEVTPFWAMEVAGVNEPEKAHATDLFKRYVYALSVGVRKVFWSGLAEKPPQKATPFDDPLEKATLIDGYGQKKLAYYTYKKMVSALDGFELGAIQTLKADGTYIFKFKKSGGPVWVAWRDGVGTDKVRIEASHRTKMIKVTEATPDAEKGSDINNYANFRSYGAQVINGTFEVEVGNTPLIITVE